jgi:hypothetical protein
MTAQSTFSPTRPAVGEYPISLLWGRRCARPTARLPHTSENGDRARFVQSLLHSGKSRFKNFTRKVLARKSSLPRCRPSDLVDHLHNGRDRGIRLFNLNVVVALLCKYLLTIG